MNMNGISMDMGPFSSKATAHWLVEWLALNDCLNYIGWKFCSSDMTAVQAVYNRINEVDDDDDEYDVDDMHASYQEMRPPVPPRRKRPLS